MYLPKLPRVFYSKPVYYAALAGFTPWPLLLPEVSWLTVGAQVACGLLWVWIDVTHPRN